MYGQYILSCCLDFRTEWISEIPKEIQHSIVSVHADVHSSFNAT